ncbi:nucleotide exchange factor GrpE [Treponema primitia]|uniref:nucleotide exchange factor GrpE n=1 Tax=Treponema primitia TaxID=88058 RepID=UPI0002555550|nr:nucleotide exchange factor GrpE [Treponema primitia]
MKDIEKTQSEEVVFVEGEPAAPAQGGSEPDLSADELSSDPAADAGADSATAAAELSPEEKIADLEEKLKEANDLYLRKAADFENFRKRMNREKQDAIDFANQSLLLDLILIIDDFDRAIKSAENMAAASKEAASTSKEFDSFYEGITLIEKRLTTQLENKWGLKRFDSAGEAFDPNRHEAIMMEKSPEITDPVVQEDFLKGYTLKDRVVRSAKVKVLMPEETPRQEN